MSLCERSIPGCRSFYRKSITMPGCPGKLAVFSMMAGLGILVWGGWTIVNDPNHVAAGSVIAAIGGAMSAYITKTFLDVHKLSLRQLNHYFKQPVLNAHILTAQRLTEQLDDKEAKRKALEGIIKRVADLVTAEQAQPVILDTQTRVSPSLREDSVGRRKKTVEMKRPETDHEG
jgi:hypothetical protein